MQIKVLIIDLRLTRRQKLLSGAALSACVALLATPGLAELDSYSSGQVLTATSLNNNFGEVDTRITSLEGRALPSGAITPYAGAETPVGWLACDGAEVSRADNAGLFDPVGVAFGPGDSVTTFNVPDLRGRVALGSGVGPGLTPRVGGDVGGLESNALTVAQLPPHSHSITDPGHAHNPFNAGNFITAGGVNNAGIAQGPGFNYTNATSSNLTGITGTANTGGGQALPTMPPYLAIQFIIKQ